MAGHLSRLPSTGAYLTANSLPFTPMIFDGEGEEEGGREREIKAPARNINVTAMMTIRFAAMSHVLPRVCPGILLLQ